MKNFKLSRKILVALTLWSIVISSIFYNLGYDIGWKNGANDVFKATTDTVISICNKQLRSDTTVTKLVIINPDTNTFYLTKKSVLID